MARAFSFYELSPEVLVFASGISDSQEKSEAAFQREEQLLRKCLATTSDLIFVYFSTCSIYDQTLKESEYVKHKIRMEEVIRRHAKKYLIFRVTQAVGKTTSKTLVNYLFNMIRSGQRFEVWSKAYRNLIDCEDVFRICSYIIERRKYINRTINVASTQDVPVPRIVEIVEGVLNKKANYLLIDKGSDYAIDLAEMLPIVKEIGLEFDDLYPERVIRKYFGRNHQSADS